MVLSPVSYLKLTTSSTGGHRHRTSSFTGFAPTHALVPSETFLIAVCLDANRQTGRRHSIKKTTTLESHRLVKRGQEDWSLIKDLEVWSLFSAVASRPVFFSGEEWEEEEEEESDP